MTNRGRRLLVAAGSAAAVAVALVGYLLLTGKEVSVSGLISGKRRPPPNCPLTEIEAPGGEVPDRPALAVKVENLSSARPQAGLNEADIVYEQPVEGGISRFIVVYQCRDAERIGPIRSARLVDADVLSQFGSPLFAYAGAVPEVVSAAEEAGVVDININVVPDAYDEDPERTPPHHLYSSTETLYGAGEAEGVPLPVFSFDPKRPGPGNSRVVRSVRATFSPEADVVWRFNRTRRVWVRFHGDEPHLLEDGSQVEAANVVIQVVEVRPSEIVDVAGNPSPEVGAIGSGEALVFRNGRVIEGTWVREDREDLTRFVDRSGDEIPLAPGTTWVELFPSDDPLSFE